MLTVVLAVVAAGALAFALYERARRVAATAARTSQPASPKEQPREPIADKVLARVSHEIRTPLSGMLGVTQMLLKTDLAGRQRELAEIIQAQGGTLLTILNDILDYSKMQAGRFGLAPADFGLRESIDDAAAVFGAQARAKNLGLDVHVDPSVPGVVHGDSGRLRQILDNLLSNAVKFTNTGSITLRVDRLEAGPDAVAVRFEVADTGIGVGADAARVLFQPFMQADAAAGRGGTGLGLAIAKSLVELIGGEIGCRAQPGGGSTFFFTAKFAPAGRGAGLPAAASPQPAAVSRIFIGRRVLVAEDNAVNRMVTSALLEDAGCTVDVVVNGKEAVAACARERYDLVLMDCRMPEMDGYQASRAIRAAAAGGRRVPIVALTAHALEDEAGRCRDAGMDDWITKPADAATLARVLDRWSTAVVSAQTLDDLERRSPAVLRTVIEHYLAGIPTDMAGLRGAVARGDRDRVQAMAHDLAGSALVVGAKELAGLLREAERGGAGLALDPWFATVDDEQRRVLAALEFRVDRPNPAT